MAPSTGSASSLPRAFSTVAANTSSSTVTTAGSPTPGECAHIVAGDSEKPTRPSTVASTSTPSPSAFGRLSTEPALEVSTRGCAARHPGRGEGGGGLVGPLPADGDPGDGGASRHPVAEPRRRGEVDHHEREQGTGHDERPAAALRRQLLPLDVVGEGVEVHAMLP